MTESDPAETDDQNQPRDRHQPDDDPMVVFEFPVPTETPRYSIQPAVEQAMAGTRSKSPWNW